MLSYEIRRPTKKLQWLCGFFTLMTSKGHVGDKHFPKSFRLAIKKTFKYQRKGVYLSRQYFRDDIQMICRMRDLYSLIFQPIESDDLRAISTFATRHQTDEKRKGVANVWQLKYFSPRPFILFVWCKIIEKQKNMRFLWMWNKSFAQLIKRWDFFWILISLFAVEKRVAPIPISFSGQLHKFSSRFSRVNVAWW